MARKHNTTAKVMGGGRITIPSEIRELENIKDCSFVRISIEKIEESTDGKRREPIPRQRRSAKGSRKKSVG